MQPSPQDSPAAPPTSSESQTSAAATGASIVLPPYRRRLGLLRNPAIRAEIAGLDAQRDCQRIVHLLTAYEFPADLTHALELALFHTYGSRSISRLLDRTGQFRRAGQKRYDDTYLLIAHFMESGWDSEVGRRALARMNEIHGHYRIPNEDFLFVLWTFIDFPLDWLRSYGWRSITPHECEAWFYYWRGIGERMGLSDIPASKDAFDLFVGDYEAREFVPDEASRKVTADTVAIFENWLPRPLRPAVRPVAACLARPRFRQAVSWPEPAALLQVLLYGALQLRRLFKRLLPLEAYPTLVGGKRYRHYPEGAPAVEELGPDRPRR